MTGHDVVLATPDAKLLRYVRTREDLTLEVELYDETVERIAVLGVTRLWDDGTWEAEAIVRLADLDADGKFGYGIIDTEGTATLRFLADELALSKAR